MAGTREGERSHLIFSISQCPCFEQHSRYLHMTFLTDNVEGCSLTLRRVRPTERETQRERERQRERELDQTSRGEREDSPHLELQYSHRMQARPVLIPLRQAHKQSEEELVAATNN
jgi:hypothetical protein